MVLAAVFFLLDKPSTTPALALAITILIVGIALAVTSKRTLIMKR